jgi:DNA-directed RNA polymerase subunit M/transcription elongation factor TFIIS
MSDTIIPPKCPKCQEPMRLWQVVPRVLGHPEIRSFRCSTCGEALTEAEPAGAAPPAAGDEQRTK